jgi:two-component system alkaline phosphatase synthesis response regulator PhoP
MQSSKKRIFLVDDEEDITFTLGIILENSGFEITSFNDPILAVQSFKPHYYDLLVLDVMMPQMNGFELYQQLRKKDIHVRVCFLTAITDLTEYDRYKKDVDLKLNKGNFVTKPIAHDDLINRINEILAINNNINYAGT